jgi:hypothetical protein
LAYIYIVSFFQPWLMKPIAELADAVKWKEDIVRKKVKDERKLLTSLSQ